MFGVVIGTLSLIALVKLWRGGFRHRFGIRGLYRYLDTTVGQEKVLQESLEVMREHGRALRSALSGTRDAASRSLRGETVDVNGMRESFEAQKAALTEAQTAVLDSLQKVHGVLDSEQRAKLARMVEGRMGGFGHGMGRGCHGGHHRHGSYSRGPAFI